MLFSISFSNCPADQPECPNINLKGVSVSMEVEGPKRLAVSVKGPGIVTAGDIEETNGIEILNKDHIICHLDDGVAFKMELTVNTGKGYVAADKQVSEDNPIGVIAIDSLFSPIKKVSYNVEPTREGQVLDYDKLTMDIETDGSVTPEDALAFASLAICLNAPSVNSKVILSNLKRYLN